MGKRNTNHWAKYEATRGWAHFSHDNLFDQNKHRDDGAAYALQTSRIVLILLILTVFYYDYIRRYLAVGGLVMYLLKNQMPFIDDPHEDFADFCWAQLVW